MIFFTIHHIVHAALPSSISDERKNLLTFLTGVFCWVLLYSYVQTAKHTTFLHRAIGSGFMYLFIADVFAMGIIYKNCYKKSILSEVNEVVGSKDDNNTVRKEAEVPDVNITTVNVVNVEGVSDNDHGQIITDDVVVGGTSQDEDTPSEDK